MKAVYYTKTGSAKSVLKIDTFDDPIIKTDEVLLEMIYSSVNPADTKKRSGWISKKIDHDLKKTNHLLEKTFGFVEARKIKNLEVALVFFQLKEKIF